MQYLGDSGKDTLVSGSYLLQVHGKTPLKTYASQVPIKASALNTNDCFVLINPEGNWVWIGKGSNGDQKKMAQRMAAPNYSVIFEGQEIEEFWALLGGQARGQQIPEMAQPGPSKPRPSVASGTQNYPFRVH